jgi:hypothetical protein
VAGVTRQMYLQFMYPCTCLTCAYILRILWVLNQSSRRLIPNLNDIVQKPYLRSKEPHSRRATVHVQTRTEPATFTLRCFRGFGSRSREEGNMSQKTAESRSGLRLTVRYHLNSRTNIV